MFNFFKKEKATKQCCNKVSDTMILEKYKKEVTECLAHINDVLEPSLLKAHSIVEKSKSRDWRKEILVKLDESLVPFYQTLNDTIDDMMRYSFKYDLGYIREKNIKKYLGALQDIEKGIIKPSRLYLSLDSLHQLYARVNVPGALKTDVNSKIRKAFIEIVIIKKTLTPLLTSICVKQNELKGKK